jgi:methionyl aminopeptidase
MRQPDQRPGTRPHVSKRVWIWLRKNAALYTILAAQKQCLRRPRPPRSQIPVLMARETRVSIKNAEEQALMRRSGRLTADVLDMIGPHVEAGVSTAELDRLCHDYIVGRQDAIPAPLDYKGFPRSICTSINHVVCHGIPGDKRLKAGDIVNIDVTVIKDGFHGDSSRMFLVGKTSVQAERLCRVAFESMWQGIRVVRPGARLGDIGHAIQSFAESHGYSVVREFCGHGIGRGFHEDPQVLHYGEPGTGLLLEPGMTFTIEPMVNAGRRHVKVLPDGWTVVTKDHSLSAQWEHTVLVTGDGVEVLTLGAADRDPRDCSA